MKNFKENIFINIILFGLLTALLSQLCVAPMEGSFRVSLGTVALSLIVGLMPNVPIIPVTALGAAGMAAGRMLNSITPVYPEIVFYIVYGSLLCLWRIRNNNALDHRFRYCGLIFFIDLVSNLTELCLRMGGKAFELVSLRNIFVVALVRVLAVFVIVNTLYLYLKILEVRSGEKKYQEMLMLTSRLDAEVIWMAKNSRTIEEVMNKSYKLARELKEANVPESISTEALSIARDVHEIKKDYFLIQRGISQALEDRDGAEAMKLSEILEIFEGPLEILAEKNSVRLKFSYSVMADFETARYFEMMTVLRNLFTNAIEAGGQKGCEKEIVISVLEIKEPGYYVLKIANKGPEIPEDIREDIFDAGFSTKINYETGEISRGLGLNLVKDLTENTFGGSISLRSDSSVTEFTLKLAEDEFNEVRDN